MAWSYYVVGAIALALMACCPCKPEIQPVPNVEFNPSPEPTNPTIKPVPIIVVPVRPLASPTP